MDGGPSFVPPLPTSPRLHISIGMIAIGVVVILLVVLVATFFFYQPFNQWVQNTFADLTGRKAELSEQEALEVLTGMRNVSGIRIPLTVYIYDTAGTRQTVPVLLGKTLIDYTRNGIYEAAIEKTGEKPTRSAIVVLGGAEPRVLAEGPGLKASVSISPDGTTVAYAELIETREVDHEKEPEFVRDSKNWTVKTKVYTVDVATGRIIEWGIGFSPYFFTKDGVTYLLYSGPEKIHIQDRDRIQPERTIAYRTTAFLPTEVSADGAYIAIGNPSRDIYEFYKLIFTKDSVHVELLPPTSRARALTFKEGYAIGVVPGVKADKSFTAYMEVLKLEEPYRSTQVADSLELINTLKLLP